MFKQIGLLLFQSSKPTDSANTIDYKLLPIRVHCRECVPKPEQYSKLPSKPDAPHPPLTDRDIP